MTGLPTAPDPPPSVHQSLADYFQFLTSAERLVNESGYLAMRRVLVDVVASTQSHHPPCQARSVASASVVVDK